MTEDERAALIESLANQLNDMAGPMAEITKRIAPNDAERDEALHILAESQALLKTVTD